MTPSSTPVAPAGWYPDPLGIPQQRWWSGLSWTNHVRSERAQAANGDRRGPTPPAAA